MARLHYQRADVFYHKCPFLGCRPWWLVSLREGHYLWYKPLVWRKNCLDKSVVKNHQIIPIAHENFLVTSDLPTSNHQFPGSYILGGRQLQRLHSTRQGYHLIHTAREWELYWCNRKQWPLIPVTVPRPVWTFLHSAVLSIFPLLIPVQFLCSVIIP